MSDSHESQLAEYKKDPRMPCQYGAKCYQKNPTHHTKYKHPPKNHRKAGGTGFVNKKRKLNNNKVEEKKQLDSDSDHNDESTSKVEDRKETISDSSSNESDKESPKIDDADFKKDSDEMISDSFSETEDDAQKTTKQKPQLSEDFDAKAFIKNKFFIEMPEDFYQFWEFCKNLKASNPVEALKDVGLKLVGPFDVLAGKFKNVNKPPEDYLRHWRYYYDPPEVQTVLKGDDRTGYHIGYFRDSPDEAPVFLVSNHGIKDGVFSKMGDNIFAAVNIYLEDVKKTGDPFKKMHVGKYLTSLKNKATELQYNLNSHSEKIRKRSYKVVADTASKLGLVVPYNKKTQLGYRELALTDKEIKTILDKLQRAAPEQKTKLLSDLQPVLTFANIALDECDFGTGVKLGLDVLAHGVDSLDSTILSFLCNSYKLLNREAFAKIAEAHLTQRKKTCDLSII